MTRRTAAAITGLAVAWGGTALLVSPVARLLVDSESSASGILGQAALWLLCVAVIGIVLFWEKRSLASLWLLPFQWQSLAWAGVLIIVHFIVLFPATEWVRRNAGLSDYTIGMETALAHSVWLRIFAAVTAGVVEETLFRGFAVTRLMELSGSTLWAVILSSGVFAVLHLPVWGAGPSLAFFIGSLAMSTFFVWRRDLLAMIIAHATIDAWALAIGPSFSPWW